MSLLVKQLADRPILPQIQLSRKKPRTHTYVCSRSHFKELETHPSLPVS